MTSVQHGRPTLSTLSQNGPLRCLSATRSVCSVIKSCTDRFMQRLPGNMSFSTQTSTVGCYLQLRANNANNNNTSIFFFQLTNQNTVNSYVTSFNPKSADKNKIQSALVCVNLSTHLWEERREEAGPTGDCSNWPKTLKAAQPPAQSKQKTSRRRSIRAAVGSGIRAPKWKPPPSRGELPPWSATRQPSSGRLKPVKRKQAQSAAAVEQIGVVCVTEGLLGVEAATAGNDSSPQQHELWFEANRKLNDTS